MPRKGNVLKRKVELDPKYGDVVISKFLNSLMRGGKKSKAEKILYGALEMIDKKTGKDSLEVFHKALRNIKPAVEVRSRRVGGTTYQIPMDVSPFRKQSLAIRWLLNAIRPRKRKGKSMAEKLSSELMDAAENKGEAIKKKEDTHRIADSNRAFAHYRW